MPDNDVHNLKINKLMQCCKLFTEQPLYYFILQWKTIFMYTVSKNIYLHIYTYAILKREAVNYE